VTERERILPQLPKSWAWANIGDFTEVLGGKRLPKGHDFSKTPTIYPYIRVTDFEKMTVNTNRLRFLKNETREVIKKYTISKDDVYISIAGSIGKVGMVPESLDSANLTENAAKIVANLVMTNKALSYALNTPFVQEQITKAIVSTNQPKLALFRIEKLFVPVPPWREQFRIVEKVEQLFSFLDTGVESLHKVQVQLKRYRQAVLKYAFEGKLTEEWRKNHKDKIEPAKDLLGKIRKKTNNDANQVYDLTSFKDNVLDKIPDTWARSNLGQLLVNSLLGLVIPISLQNKKAEGIPYIKMNNIRSDGSLDLTNLVYVTVNDSDLKKYRLEKADILFNTRNSFELVGKTSIIKTDEKAMVFNNNLMRIRLAEGIDPFFVVYQMNSPGFRNLMIREKKATTNICALYAKDLLPLPLVIAPQEEQKRIVEEIDYRISVIDKSEWYIALGFKQIEKLRQSILKNAFEGKLLSQDPSDESAEMLLCRIKEQKNNLSNINSRGLMSYVK